ncbi:dTDP-4-dehydrorhamnose 3,5-epimerase [Candidatus Falkowbacteria bacterium]|nr:dTDP-4-dehydrorhamnose 3,5-epimerase [Candidatus Falkowbacteria bacterium]
MPFVFKNLEIPGLVLAEGRKFGDDRGFFLETYKQSEFRAGGIMEEFVQDNYSVSKKGTVRGLHFQLDPYAQGKLVQVISGRVWDVAVDIRKSSPTFGQWYGIELSGDDTKLFYIPAGFAHGFVALEDDTQFMYKCTAEYNKESEGGIRYDDPDLAIAWPLKDGLLVSEKDAILPFFKEAKYFQ